MRAVIRLRAAPVLLGAKEAEKREAAQALATVLVRKPEMGLEAELQVTAAARTSNVVQASS